MKTTALPALLLATTLAAMSAVLAQAAPTGETLSSDFKVWAEDRPIAVYKARVLDPPFAGKQWDYGGAYSFANFDMTGRITVRIVSPRSLAHTTIRPPTANVTMAMVDDHTMTLTIDKPCKISLEPDGKRGPLLLFANPPEIDVPRADFPDVIYFGPGQHRPDLIQAGNNETVYLADGAVVKGAIVARGTNIQIRGRGILDGSDYEWRKGPHAFTLGIYATNITISGITIRGSSHWTIVPRGSRHVTVRNVKICGGRVQNDDGINPCNSQDVLITDCFIRSDDDCVALKGLDFAIPDSNVERITVEDCVLWCDRARVFLLGHESRAHFMRDVVLRDLDIIHFSMTPFLFEPGEDMRLESIRVENVRLHGEGQGELIRLKPAVNQYMKKKVPGFIRDVRFQNIVVAGQPGDYRITLAGADPQHGVRDVSFENISILNENLRRNAPRMNIGSHVSGLQFVDSAEPGSVKNHKQAPRNQP